MIIMECKSFIIISIVIFTYNTLLSTGVIMPSSRAALLSASDNITTLNYIASLTVIDEVDCRSLTDCTIKCTEAIFCLMVEYISTTKKCKMYVHNGLNSPPGTAAAYDNTGATTYHVHTYNSKYYISCTIQ